MHVAVVGATGAVGREVCSILQQRRFQAQRFSFFSSERSAGQTIDLQGQPHTVQTFTDHSLRGVDLAFFCAGAKISRRFAEPERRRGTIIIDNSSAFRMQPDVPLVIPEINPQDIRKHQGIIANPNCSAILLNMVVWPMHVANPVRRIIVSTYQAVSGAGAKAMHELQRQTEAMLHGKKETPEIFPHPCAFNLFSHNSPIDETGYNEEERKIACETRKIFHDDRIAVTATCIRVPILRAHSESVHLEFERPITARAVRKILETAPGVRVVDDRDRNYFPMPSDAGGQDDVLVGRIREDFSDLTGRSIQLFLSGDQLRKGAALNAVQIAEYLLQ